MPVALLLSVTEPVRVPRAAGVKTTLIVQLPPAERAEGQLLVCAKFPETVKPLTERVPVPVFVRVTFLALPVVPTICEPKVRETGLNEALRVNPDPDRDMVCGLPASASSVIDMVPERVPDAVGVKVTLRVQFAPDARELGQLLVCV